MQRTPEKVRIIEVNVNPDAYPPGEGYVFARDADYFTKIGEVTSEATKLIAEVGKNFLLKAAMTQHHAHSKPTNYSQVYWENKIRMDALRRQAYEEGVVEPRTKRAYHLKPGSFATGHVDTQSQKNTNAWLVSFAADDGIDPQRSILCFSKSDAEWLQSNGKALINEMPLVAMKIDWGKIYSASDLLSQFDPHCRELHQANIQLDNTIMELMRQNPLGRSLFECIGGLEATDPKGAGNMYELLPFLLAKYLILEVSNNHHNKELFESAYNKLTFSGYLYDNYLLIEIVRRELIGKQED